ncbi:retrovirus-related pol polyprotein from transposon TNT 1-94 [Tanacetum coccineum]
MMQVNVQFLQQLQPEWSRFVTIVKQQHKLDEVSYHKFFDILKQYQKEVNEIRAERISKNANPLALVATAQPHQDPYYQTPKHKCKEIAKPITPPSESASEEDSDPEQAQKDKEMQKNLALIAKNQRTMTVVGARETVGSPVVKQSGIQCFNCKEFGHFAKECRKPKRVKDSTYHKEKMLLCKQAEKGVPLQAEQSDWLADTDEEIDEQELEAHYSYMAKIQEVPTADSGTDSEPLEHVQYDTGYNMFADEIQHFEQSESISNTWVDKLESDKAEFSNMYDMLLQECVSNNVMCSYLHSLSDLDAHTELQCLYLHKVKECDCLAQKLSKQTESVSKEVYTKLVQSFAKLEKYSISLELALQQCQEQIKNDTVCKVTASNVFQKEREQYLKIQDLKAQLQDKNIAICELKKLIEKCKGKSVETKFDKPSVVRQPNAQRIPKPSVLGKPAPFSDSLKRKFFSKNKLVPKTNESEGLSKPVTLQNFPQTATQAVRNTNVIKPDMYQIDTKTTQTRAPQLPQTSRNNNPHVSTSTGVNHRTNVSRPQLKSTQMKDKSVTACNDSLKSRTSNVNAVCGTCGKYMFNSNHDACVSKYLNDVNARTKKPKVVPISTRKPKSQANKSVATHRNDLLTDNCGSDLYTISLQETASSTLICLMAKASPTQAWLWHRRIFHLNFDYINLILKKYVVIGLPKLKYVKDQLCFSCKVIKAKRSSFKTKTVPSSKGRLNVLYMDLCGPMRVASINGKKYILVIIDDYSRYTWTLFLRSKDETPEVLKDFFTMIQRNLQAPVISVRTDRGTEFLNKTLHAFFKEEGIEHQTSTPQTPEQNGIVEI